MGVMRRIVRLGAGGTGGIGNLRVEMGGMEGFVVRCPVDRMIFIFSCFWRRVDGERMLTASFDTVFLFASWRCRVRAGVGWLKGKWMWVAVLLTFAESQCGGARVRTDERVGISFSVGDASLA